ncbi:MAG: site-2 protease family protein [Candidatus Diapherotrites archaeon]|uniref:Site-2 protease family protein n=1 Tax=Candidatus Iainarchaeum sp. TaxID=3101447 RepID=A0A938YX34_9ARCH|nr:site-2 protease family protein [Candidatus Diapherotrites archaeon]
MKARERNDLLISWVTLSLAFSLVISDSFLSLMGIAEAIPIAFLAVGTGFIFHEMAHRQMARKYGFHAEYRAWNFGLVFAFLLALISGGRFIFAAPGATYIFAQNISLKQNGKISIAGPTVNIIIGFILFFASLLAFDKFTFGLLFNAAWINFWFAFFNLLPIHPLDGGKVMAWSKAAWAAGIVTAGIMAFFSADLLIAIASLL